MALRIRQGLYVRLLTNCVVCLVFIIHTLQWRAVHFMLVGHGFRMLSVVSSQVPLEKVDHDLRYKDLTSQLLSLEVLAPSTYLLHRVQKHRDLNVCPRHIVRCVPHGGHERDA